MQKTTTKVIVDRSKKSKRQITYTIYPDQATVRDRWQIQGEKYVHDWSCDCGQAGCRHIVLAKAKAFEKTMPAPADKYPCPDEPHKPFKPFLED
jgi:hypothetical protein